jgi:hypothetical protein
MTSSLTSSSRTRVEHYPANLTKHSYPSTASDRVRAYTGVSSSHMGITNWAPPPDIIFPPSLNQASSVSHLPAVTGTLNRDPVSASNPRKRSVKDALFFFWGQRPVIGRRTQLCDLRSHPQIPSIINTSRPSTRLQRRPTLKARPDLCGVLIVVPRNLHTFRQASRAQWKKEARTFLLNTRLRSLM